MASFITDSLGTNKYKKKNSIWNSICLEILVPNIKTTPAAPRSASKLISGLRPFITGLKTVCILKRHSKRKFWCNYLGIEF